MQWAPSLNETFSSEGWGDVQVKVNVDKITKKETTLSNTYKSMFNGHYLINYFWVTQDRNKCSSLIILGNPRSLNVAQSEQTPAEDS